MKLFSVLSPILLSSWLNMACSNTITVPATNAASPQTATTSYEPVRGQAGKDVIWIPTPEGLIDKMLTAAKVTDQDRLFDLGAGDGIIAITAARKYGARSVGIEYNPDMAQFARRKVAEAGMTDKVQIITGDIFQEDFSSATVVTLYLMPHLNLKLRPILLKMKPGTRVSLVKIMVGVPLMPCLLARRLLRSMAAVSHVAAAGGWPLTIQSL